MHRQFSARNEDAGFTLVEVVVAMLVFAIIATGFLYTATSALTQTRDTRARVVAASLASQKIDMIRAASSVFAVLDSTTSKTLNGDTFHIKVTTAWMTSTGASATCASGTAAGSLSYREVTVEVTWDNMRAGARPVFADTSLAPKTKINDPALGTVLVGVIDSAGVGVSGATVSISASGVAAVTTDSDGCAYLLKVPVGTYTVTLSKTGYISDQQLPTPTVASVPVSAGGSSQLSFGYDRAATFTTSYAKNVAGTISLPTDLKTTFMSTYGNFPYANAATAITNTNAQTITRFPYSSGYSVVAGSYVESPGNPAASCLAPDPGQWVATPTLVGKRPDAVGGAPGGTSAVSVPMGVVKLSSPNGTGSYLTAVYVGGGSGDPGCGVGMKYAFSTVLSSTTATVALPYGTWKLYRGTASGAPTTQITSGITVASTTGASGVTSGTVLLDPRVAP